MKKDSRTLATKRFQSYKSRLKLQYGLSIDDYNDMFKAQGGKCAICRKHQSEIKKSLHVDHCHKTGKIRGLLCSNCNHGLGKFLDSSDIIESALYYLIHYK